MRGFRALVRLRSHHAEKLLIKERAKARRAEMTAAARKGPNTRTLGELEDWWSAKLAAWAKGNRLAAGGRLKITRFKTVRVTARFIVRAFPPNPQAQYAGLSIAEARLALKLPPPTLARIGA